MSMENWSSSFLPVPDFFVVSSAGFVASFLSIPVVIPSNTSCLSFTIWSFSLNLELKACSWEESWPRDCFSCWSGKLARRQSLFLQELFQTWFLRVWWSRCLACPPHSWSLLDEWEYPGLNSWLQECLCLHKYVNSPAVAALAMGDADIMLWNV